MPTPIILVSGEAGSGKDTVASLIQKYTNNTVCIAQADPMKRFALKVFGFDEHQLWGPSEARNAPDQRFENLNAWNQAYGNICTDQIFVWLQDVLPDLDSQGRVLARKALVEWFENLAADHGLFVDDLSGFVKGTPQKILTPRFMLQTLGTEWGRNFSKNMWVDYAIRASKELLGGGRGYDRTVGVFAEPNPVPDYVVITDGRFVNEINIVAQQGATSIRVVNPTVTADAIKVEAAGVKGHASEKELKSIPPHFYDIEVLNDKSQGLGVLEMKIIKLVKHLKERTLKF